MDSKNIHVETKALLALVIGSVCTSFAPVFVKMLGENIIGPTAIAFWRTLLGAVILFGIILVKGDSFKLPKSIFIFAVLAGAFFYADLFVWHRSIIFAGAGLSTILGNTQVFWMALFGVVLFKERLSPVYLVAVFLAFTGVSLLVGFGSDVSFTESYLSGIIYGLLTGVFYGCYLATLKSAGHKKETFSFLTMIAWTSLSCAVFCGISMMVESDVYIPPDAYSLTVLLALAVVVQVFGWWIISHNLPKLKASRSGIVLLIQPTLATVWGFLIFAEQLSMLQIFGAMLTLVAIYIGSKRNHR